MKEEETLREAACHVPDEGGETLLILDFNGERVAAPLACFVHCPRSFALILPLVIGVAIRSRLPPEAGMMIERAYAAEEE